MSKQSTDLSLLTLSESGKLAVWPVVQATRRKIVTIRDGEPITLRLESRFFVGRRGLLSVKRLKHRVRNSAELGLRHSFELLPTVRALELFEKYKPLESSVDNWACRVDPSGIPQHIRSRCEECEDKIKTRLGFVKMYEEEIASLEQEIERMTELLAAAGV